MSNSVMRPRLGTDVGANYNNRILVVCFYDPNGISTVWENVGLLQTFSQYNFEILNLWPGRSGLLEIPSSTQLNDYVGIFIHPTACYNPDNLTNLDKGLSTKFEHYEGVKILAKQDEHFRSAAFPKFVKDNKFDILLTCIPRDQIGKVYENNILDSITVIHTLTGYVSETLRSVYSKPYRERRVDLAYRGSIQPISFGRLGYEKRQIGVGVQRHPASKNLQLDISSRWEDRISGLEWFKFLGDAKAVLGVESGSNLFDFDGKISELCLEFEINHPNIDPSSDVFYEMARSEFLDQHEDNVVYAQISPRHFEAAATKSLQVMFEGRYSDIFIPHKHFVPLKRDFSNFEEVIEVLNDEKKYKLITEAAYEDIILNDSYTYKYFVRELDEAIAAKIETKGLRQNRGRRASAAKENGSVLIMCAHDPVVDPRIGWWASSFNATSTVCELGTYRFSEIGDGPSVVSVSNSHWRVKVERTRHGSAWKSGDGEAVLSTPGIKDIALLDIYKNSTHQEIAKAIGGLDADDVDIYRFKDLCRYFVNTNSALIQAALNMGKFDCIVCSDLESLPAGVALKQIWGCHLIFDSHEYWPFSYSEFRAWESEFWSKLEGRLARSADRCLTVSETLAAHLSSEYGLHFTSVPNATPLADARGEELDKARENKARIASTSPNEKVTFLFQGNFAAGRGLELLVTAWTSVTDNAILHLRGPDNSFKEQIVKLSKENGTFERTVFFPPAVSEVDLVRYAQMADVGIIPYDARHYANKFACPNKLSQYMAAGLPILSNRIEYISSIVDTNEIGETVPFHDEKLLVKTIDRWASDPELVIRTGLASRAFFEKSFNWDILSKRTIEETYEALAAQKKNSGEINFDWVADDMSMSKQRVSENVSPSDVDREAQASENATVALEISPTPLYENRQRRGALRFLWRLLPRPLRHRLAEQLRRSGVLR